MCPTITAAVIPPQVPITTPSISRKGNQRHHSRVDDIATIRLKHFRELLEKHAPGNQSEFGRLIGLEPNLVNRILRRKKGIGDKLARKIERQLGVAANWMDNVHSTDLEHVVLIAFREATPERQGAVLRVLEIEPPFRTSAMRRVSLQKRA